MELTAAAMLAVFALLQLVAPVLVPVFVAPIVLFAPRLVLRARGRLTYSRIGYVELPRAARRRIALGMLAFVAGGLAVTLMVVAVTGDIDDPARWRKMAPLFAGLLGSGGFLYAATWSGLARYHAVAGLSALAGTAAAVLGTGADYRPVAAYLLVMAALLALIGAATLVRFVRLNPVLDDTGAVDGPA